VPISSFYFFEVRAIIKGLELSNQVSENLIEYIETRYIRSETPMPIFLNVGLTVCRHYSKKYVRIQMYADKLRFVNLNRIAFTYT
jgi:uncharacterized membrane protein (UPF0136 family)